MDLGGDPLVSHAGCRPFCFFADDLDITSLALKTSTEPWPIKTKRTAISI